MNKRIIAVLAILCGFACAVFAASSRKDIDAFLKEYEAFVVKAEKAAASNKLSDLTQMSLESVKLVEKYEKLEETDEWTVTDAKKYLDLSNRYAKAASKITSDLTSDTDALLKAYGY